MKTNSANGTAIQTALRPATLDAIPGRVRRIAMLRGLGDSYRQIAGPLQVTPQAVSLMLKRHRRSLKSLRDAMELNSLSGRAVNALGRHGIRTREQARQANVLECLADERNRGRKTIDEIARSMVDNSGVNPPEDDGYGPRAGLCLEPQNFPDAPNHSHFPKSRLDPGEVYSSRVVYMFAAS